jgi:hypothetical protein
MSDPEETATPRGQPTEPGWYSDPEGVRSHQAYWDGEKWTGETRRPRGRVWTRWVGYGAIGLAGLFGLGLLSGQMGLSGRVLIEEDFENDIGVPFAQESDRFIQMEVVDGEYRVDIDDPYSPHLIRSFFDTTAGSVAFEATLQTSFEPEDRLLTSIGCFNSDAGYLMVLVTSGDAILLETVSENTGQRQPLSEPVAVEGFTSGTPVKLEIDCVGGGTDPTIVSGWVNETPVLSVAVENGMDSFNAVAFWLGTEEADGAEFRIDNVLVTEGPTDVPMQPSSQVTISDR